MSSAAVIVLCGARWTAFVLPHSADDGMPAIRKNVVYRADFDWLRTVTLPRKTGDYRHRIYLKSQRPIHPGAMIYILSCAASQVRKESHLRHTPS